MAIEVTNKKNSYLYRQSESPYYSGLSDALDSLASHTAGIQFRRLLNAFQVSDQAFNEATYLQTACETTIAAYFAKTYGNDFVYEPKINPPKDVDCGFKLDGKTYNIEVKCPDFTKKHQIDNSNSFKIGALGRVPGFESILSNMRPVFDVKANPAAEPDKPLVQQQHMDNKLKDFLLSAHAKFKDSTGPDELNVLAVCCADPMDMQKWFHYMYNQEGLFTCKSFHPPSQYNNVDVILLTNLYHRHHRYWTKDKIKQHWDFTKAFNLIFSNPQRQQSKEAAIRALIRVIPNHSMRLNNFKVMNGLDEMRITHYIVEELQSKGLYYFQPDS